MCLKLDIAVHLLCLTILQNAREDLRPFCVDDVEFLQVAQEEGQKILVEGAQSALLDLQFGTYPYCTSTNTTFGGVMAGLSLDRRKIDNVIGVIKAYTVSILFQALGLS